MIVAAALRYDRVILSIPRPARHSDILHATHAQFEGYDLEQGFLTDEGKFLDRKQAMVHQLATGFGLPRREQILAYNPNAYNGDELFSEDLW